MKYDQINKPKIVSIYLIVLFIVLLNTHSVHADPIKTTTTNYEYRAWGEYRIINLDGEKYIPLRNNVDKVAKLIIDSNDLYVLRPDEKLDIGHGYSLTTKQVSMDDKNVWFELDYNGQYVDDRVISTSSGDQIWTCNLDGIMGEDNIPVFKLHVNQIFQGTVVGLVQVDGLWLIDYVNANTLESFLLPTPVVSAPVVQTPVVAAPIVSPTPENKTLPKIEPTPVTLVVINKTSPTQELPKSFFTYVEYFVRLNIALVCLWFFFYGHKKL